MSDFSPDDGSALTDGVRRGDPLAFRQLFDQLYGPVRRYAASLVRDEAVADDVVQEAFVRLWDRRARLEAATPPRAWLYRTVRNLALNLRRDAATRQRLLSDPAVAETAAVPRPVTSPDDEVVGRDLGAQLTVLIEALPRRQREALLLSRVEGLSHAEVAAAMDCAPRTVNNHLVAALSSLRRWLAEAGTMVAAMLWWVS
ncbi:MAG: RNA polymerase sigma factor [Gemmatimonas sp.]|jgi:RNA polymerase sigma-70 factor (family 1)|uniref:RNA polymerase sigma factor n=1 Tax=Gemmatimonas sp. TaxID=1962908 RepID=UPI00391F3C20|nr:sigma-70 family RNA polymerase sigma factor [Gemmatimonadota bacterium]